MTVGQTFGAQRAASRVLRLVVAVSLGLAASGCAQLGLGEEMASLTALKSEEPQSMQAGDVAVAPKTDLQKATEYWGKEYAKNPRKIENVLSYAKNLKAMGQKPQALAVLQEASIYHANDRELASEYGRLALESEQITLASQLLEMADDPAKPDWRVVSARGAAAAKLGKYQEAVSHLERAQALAPDKPSVMNNLALAYTMNGEPSKAEDLLRRAGSEEGASPKVRQNLALVLGLQGKYDEATRVASADIPASTAKANTDLLKKMVRLEPKSDTVPAFAAPVIAVAAKPELKPATADMAAASSAWSSNVVAAAP